MARSGKRRTARRLQTSSQIPIHSVNEEGGYQSCSEKCRPVQLLNSVNEKHLTKPQPSFSNSPNSRRFIDGFSFQPQSWFFLPIPTRSIAAQSTSMTANGASGFGLTSTTGITAGTARRNSMSWSANAIFSGWSSHQGYFAQPCNGSSPPASSLGAPRASPSEGISFDPFQRLALTPSKQVDSRKLGGRWKSTGAFKLVACIESQLLKDSAREKSLAQIVPAPRPL